MRSPLEELLRRVRDCAGPDRIVEFGVADLVKDAPCIGPASHYTRSIDAAISLLPDKCLGRGDSLSVNTGVDMGGYNYTASIRINGKRQRVSARTMAGAISACIIKDRMENSQ